jgi:hypothetical protein
MMPPIDGMRREVTSTSCKADSAAKDPVDWAKACGASAAMTAAATNETPATGRIATGQTTEFMIDAHLTKIDEVRFDHTAMTLR